MRVEFDPEALKALAADPGVVGAVEAVGEQVATRANANAAAHLIDHGGGGIGSVESTVDHDDEGQFARIAPDVDHTYMWYAEFGTVTERARPFIRPALYTQSSEGN